MNAILYLLKTCCQWRMIPKDFAPWESVCYYFSKWKNGGVIEELLDNIRSQARTMSGREESPSLGIIDSRSVKTSHHVDSDRGLDGNKKVKGRKHNIIFDTQGNLKAIAVHEANIHDSKGAPEVIGNLSCKFPRLAKILADGGYRGDLANWKLSSGLMNVRPNSKLSPSGGLLKGHSPGWKTSEGSQLTMSIMPTLPKQWFNLHSVKSCLTNLLDNF